MSTAKAYEFVDVETTDYKVKLDIFEGPLDLLLYLIKKDEVDIHTISIERITKQYLTYMDTFKMLNIDLASEFIVMAANLMYIKSRTLLPKSVQPPEEEVEEDDPRWELIRQLIEYKKFKDAAGFLLQKETEQEDYYAHVAEKLEQAEMDFTEPLPDVNIFDLIQAFQNVLKRFEEATDLGEIVDDRFTVADKIESLLTLLSPGGKLHFVSLFDDSTSKTEMIVTFLAVLELMKMNQFSILQDHILGNIEVHRRAL
ncbi:MAG: segregation and condensation protein A [Akkermansiaceae bacterium]